MQCLVESPAGVFQVASPQPVDTTTCTYILADVSELNQLFPPLTIEEGTLIGTSIWVCWVVAWGFSMLSKSLDVIDENNEG